PLANPRAARVTRIEAEGLHGFGLLQRDRSFASYQDNEAMYHRRPSLWVEPQDGFGAGAVHLLELPTDNEFNDTIVAFWGRGEDGRAGRGMAVGYRVWALAGDPPSASPATTLALAIATRIAASRLPGAAGAAHAHRVIVDFAGGPLERLAPEAAVTARAEAQG